MSSSGSPLQYTISGSAQVNWLIQTSAPPSLYVHCSMPINFIHNTSNKVYKPINKTSPMLTWNKKIMLKMNFHIFSIRLWNLVNFTENYPGNFLLRRCWKMFMEKKKPEILPDLQRIQSYWSRMNRQEANFSQWENKQFSQGSVFSLLLWTLQPLSWCLSHALARGPLIYFTW